MTHVYRVTVHTDQVKDAVVHYARTQFNNELPVMVEYFEDGPRYEIEVECRPEQIERIYGFLDGIYILQ